MIKAQSKTAPKEQPNFKVGGLVIAVRDSIAYKVGDLFEINAIKRGCNCHPLLLAIGKKGGSRCGMCGADYGNDEVWFLGENFAPYKQSKKKMTIEALFKEMGV